MKIPQRTPRPRRAQSPNAVPVGVRWPCRSGPRPRKLFLRRTHGFHTRTGVLFFPFPNHPTRQPTRARTPRTTQTLAGSRARVQRLHPRACIERRQLPALLPRGARWRELHRHGRAAGQGRLAPVHPGRQTAVRCRPERTRGARRGPRPGIPVALRSGQHALSRHAERGQRRIACTAMRWVRWPPSRPVPATGCRPTTAHCCCAKWSCSASGWQENISGSH